MYNQQRIRASSLAAAIAISTLRVSVAQAQPSCPIDAPVPATLGFAAYVCYGGSCEVAKLDDEGPWHDFTVEPEVRGIDPAGPARGLLREGDVIVAVNGIPITSRAGGRAIAQLAPARSAAIRVRRASRDVEIAIVPARKCHRPGIMVASSPESALAASQLASTILMRGSDSQGAERRGQSGNIGTGRLDPRELTGALSSLESAAVAPVDFGLTLACGECGWRRRADRVVFHSLELPVVIAVQPGGPGAHAGIQVGDTLVAIGGIAFRASAGASVWSTLRPGRAVAFHVRRGTSRSVQIVPTASLNRF